MPGELNFLAAFLVGLFGSTHCVGMCGGIVSALSLGIEQPSRRKKTTLLLFLLAYNFGRILSYVLVGIIAGSIGAGLLRFGPTIDFPLGSLITAFFMISLGLYLANWWRMLTVIEATGHWLWEKIEPWGRRFLPVHNPLQAFGLGLVWGWLPCGLVYSVVAWSLTTSDALQAAMLMAGFGLGTMPAMLLVGAGAAHFGLSLKRQGPRTIAGVAIISFGLYVGISGIAHHWNYSQQDSVAVANHRVHSSELPVEY